MPAEPSPSLVDTRRSHADRARQVAALLMVERLTRLADPDPRVRRAAVTALTETVPPGAGVALAEAAGDKSGTVRHAAVAGLRELAGVLSASETLAGETLAYALRRRLNSPDPAVRAGILEVLAQLCASDPAPFARALEDPDHRVRLRAVRGLAIAGQDSLLAAAVSDTAREVRIAVAEGIAALGAGADEAAGALERLAADRDPTVQAAAFKAAAPLGCPPPLGTLAAGAVRAAPAWEVRAGAAQALAAASADMAVGPLTKAAGDPHADVRKAAVIALAQFRGHPDAAAALAVARSDSDADVRAYAR